MKAETLRVMLHYSPESGKWTWLQCGHSRFNGRRADHPRDKKRSYRIVTIEKTKYYAHRLAWLYMTGEWPVSDLDHRDLDKSNNIWSNLRLATDQLNNANKKPKIRALPKGVDRRSDSIHRPYQARIKYNNKSIHLGQFSTPEEAGRAYRRAAKRYFGEFARTQ